MAENWYDLLIPGRGVDESLPPHLLKPGALADCKNVSLVPPLTHRLGMGKRPGTVLGFLNAVGQAGAGPRGVPITGAVRCIRAANQTVNLAGNYINVDDDFTTYATPYTYGGTFRTGTDFKGRYVLFSKDPTAAFAVKNPATGVYPDAPYVPANSTDPRAPGRELRVTSLPIAASHNYGLAVNFPTQNRIKATMKILADPFGNTGADLTPTYGQCTNLAVFVRGSENLGDFVCGYLVATATDVVSLRIETHVAGTVTTYTSATSHTLARGPGPSVFTLELIATPSAVSLKCVWGDQDIDETFTKSENPPGLVLATENRAGLIFRHAGTNIYRTVTRLEFTTLVPLEKVVDFQIRATDADPTQGRWQLPKGWDSLYITNTAIAGKSGASAAYSENDSRPTVEYPLIDRVGISPASGAAAEAQIYGGQAASEVGEGGVNNGGALVNRSRLMIPSALATDAAVNALTTTNDVELEFNDNDGTIDDAIGAALRIDGVDGSYA